MANYDIALTIPAAISNGKIELIRKEDNIVYAEFEVDRYIDIPVYEWNDSTISNFDMDLVSVPLSDLITYPKGIIWSTEPNQTTDELSNFCWVNTRENNLYQSDILNFGRVQVKESISNTYNPSAAQNMYPFALIKTISGYISLISRTPGSPYDEYFVSNFGGLNNVDRATVNDVYPFARSLVPEPDSIVIRPSLPVVESDSSLQFTAVFKYQDSNDIEMTPDNGRWEIGDIGDSDISIDSNGLLTIGSNISVSQLIVKAVWLGTEYNKSVSTTVYLTGINEDGNPYTPGSGGGVPSWTGGGGGNFGVVNGTPEASDPIAPFLPGIGTPSGSVEGSVSNSGLFVHYAMNGTSLQILGDWLWANELGLAIAKEFISLLYGSPIESAISLMSYPFDIKTLRGVQINSQEVYWGGHASGVTAPAITNPYATIDWGTIQLTEFWGNFLDYAPHTKLELYLPWCTGFVPIDPNECLPGSLRVVTNIELAKGTCLHNVIGNDGRVIATHAGTCGKQLPLTALDTSGKALAFVTSAVAGATVGGAAIAGAMGGAMYPGSQPITLHSPYDPNKHRYLMMDKYPSISSISEGAKMGAGMFGRAAKKPAVMAASAGLRAQVSVSRNGSFTGSTAGLGVQFPYLIISRPTQSVPAQYGHHYGYPSNIYTPLANLRGYTEVGEIHLTGFVCTEEELEEIDSILKGGVIL